MDKGELEEKLKSLGDIDEQSKKEIVCSLIGHSNIMKACFGYHHCGRCDALVGDSLGGAYQNPEAVYVGHNCETCRKNYKELTWQDTFLAPSGKEIFT